MTSLLFYDKPVALNKSAHKDLKIKASAADFSFATETNSVILAGVEFTEAAKEYPIVFAQAGDSMVPVALLGLRNAENLFVDAKGQWDAKYIPAFVRRYPFVLAETSEEGQRMVCIDEAFSGFGDKEGEALFENDAPTPVLQQAIDFLEEYQRQYIRTERFISRLKELDLLMALNAKVDMADGQTFALTGLMVVDEKKLLELEDSKALDFFKSGELAWVYCHLMSLGNMARMIDRIALASGKPAPGPSSETPPEGKPKAKAKKS